MSTNRLTSYAYTKVADAFNDGYSVANLLNEFAQRADIASGEIVLIGAIQAAIEIGVSHRKLGLIKNQQSVLNNDREILFIDLERAWARKGEQDLTAWLGDIIGSIDAIPKTSRCKVELSFVNETASAPAPNVNVRVVMPPTTEVSIVSMPDRHTTTKILRDNAGNITESIQIEKDAG